MAATIKNACDAILLNPSLWNQPHFAPIRHLSYQVTANPLKYPPPPGINGVKLGGQQQLTNGFAKSVYGNTIRIRECVKQSPVLQLVHFSTDYRNTNVVACNVKENVKRVTLQASDGDWNLVTIKGASQNNDHIGVLRVGDVIELINFHVLVIDYGAQGE